MGVPPPPLAEPTRGSNHTRVTSEQLGVLNNQHHDMIVYDSSNNHYGDTYSTSNIVYGPTTNIGRVDMVMDNDYVLFDTLPKHPDISSRWNDYLEDSRDEDMMRIRGWGDDLEAKELALWVHSPAGTGKSTLARQLTHNLWSQNRLAASVFFSILWTDTMGPETIFRLIGGEIGRVHPSTIPIIARAVRKCHGAPLQVLLEMFVRDPLRFIQFPYPLIVVMDAVDEWRPHYHFFKELRHISSLSSLVRFVVFSRSEPRLQHLKELSIRSHPLLPINVEVIQRYIDGRFSKIGWPAGRKPREHQVMSLARMANGLFIWIATTCALLERSCSDPYDTLTSIIHNRHNIRENQTLAKLYYDAIGLLFPDPESKDAVRELLGFTLVLQEPLPVEAFCSLSSVNAYTLALTMEKLKALQIRHPTSSCDTVYPANILFHASFVEYLGGDSIPPEIGFHIPLAAFHLQLESIYGVKLWPFHVVAGTLPEEPDLTQLERQVKQPVLLRRLARQTKALILKRTTVDRNKLVMRTGMMNLLEGVVTSDQLYRWAPLFLEAVQPECSSSPPIDDCMPMFMCTVAAWVDATAARAMVFKVPCLEVAVRVAPYDAENWRKLGDAYAKLAAITDSIEPLHQGVSAHRHALNVSQASQVRGRALYMDALALSLRNRAERLGDVGDVEVAICLEREVLKMKLYPPQLDRAQPLHRLAASLQCRFQQARSARDLEEAILLYRQAVKLRPSGHPDRPLSLNNLASALLSRFQQSGLVEGLDEAIMLLREALELRPSGHPDQAKPLNNLANALQSSFEQSGLAEDLEEAIVLHREALRLCPLGHPDRAGSLNNLANTLQSSFKQLGMAQGLPEVIALYREALKLHPSGHPCRSLSLYNLASALQSSFEQSGLTEELEEAIVLHREALKLRPTGHPDRSSSLNNLANALYSLFGVSDSARDIDEAIASGREVLHLRPPGHPKRANTLWNLRLYLHDRFLHQDTVEDLREAITLSEEALALYKSGSPDHGALHDAISLVYTRELSEATLTSDDGLGSDEGIE